MSEFGFLIFITIFIILPVFFAALECISLNLFKTEISDLICNLLRRYQHNKKQKELFNRSKKIINKHNRQKGTINYEATKYEYKALMAYIELVLRDIPEINKNCEIRDLYVLKLDYYYRELKLIKDANNCSIESLACLIKAIMEEPLVSDNELNLKIISEIINKFYSGVYFMFFNYSALNFTSKNKSEVMKKAMDDYIKYKNDIFIISYFLLKELNI